MFLCWTSADESCNSVVIDAGAVRASDTVWESVLCPPEHGRFHGLDVQIIQ